MREDSLNEVAPANGQPVDKAYRSRSARVLVPLWALLMLANLIWAISGHGSILAAAIFLVASLLGLLRLGWPRDTWPTWLFSYKP